MLSCFKNNVRLGVFRILFQLKITVPGSILNILQSDSIMWSTRSLFYTLSWIKVQQDYFPFKLVSLGAIYFIHHHYALKL